MQIVKDEDLPHTQTEMHAAVCYGRRQHKRRLDSGNYGKESNILKSTKEKTKHTSLISAFSPLLEPNAAQPAHAVRPPLLLFASLW